MRVLVCGGRDFSDSAALYRKLDWFARKHLVDVVIEGDARGADRMAGYWARKRRIENLKFPADWGRWGKRAGYVRNVEMLEKGKPDVVLAFPGGRGTEMMTGLARERGIQVIEFSLADVD